VPLALVVVVLAVDAVPAPVAATVGLAWPVGDGSGPGEPQVKGVPATVHATRSSTATTPAPAAIGTTGRRRAGTGVSAGTAVGWIDGGVAAAGPGSGTRGDGATTGAWLDSGTPARNARSRPS
jgi:hypothetical protein